MLRFLWGTCPVKLNNPVAVFIVDGSLKQLIFRNILVQAFFNFHCTRMAGFLCSQNSSEENIESGIEFYEVFRLAAPTTSCTCRIILKIVNLLYREQLLSRDTVLTWERLPRCAGIPSTSERCDHMPMSKYRTSPVFSVFKVVKLSLKRSLARECAFIRFVWVFFLSIIVGQHSFATQVSLNGQFSFYIHSNCYMCLCETNPYW